MLLLLLLLLICISSQCFENQPNKICSHLSEKASKGMFHKPKKLQNHSNKGKGKEKKKERGEAKEEKKKNPMVSLLVFIIATLKIHLAIELSKIWLDTYVLGYLSMKWNRAISFHCQWIHSSSSSSLLLLLLTYCKFSFNISGAEYIYFSSVLLITCYFLLWFWTVFEPSAGFLFRNFCLFVFIRFLIFSQRDPADNNTWYWRVILDKYSIIIIIIFIIITIIIIIIITTENKKGGYMLLLNIYVRLSGFQSCLRSYLHPPLSEYLFSMRRRVTKT